MLYKSNVKLPFESFENFIKLITEPWRVFFIEKSAISTVSWMQEKAFATCNLPRERILCSFLRLAAFAGFYEALLRSFRVESILQLFTYVYLVTRERVQCTSDELRQGLLRNFALKRRWKFISRLPYESFDPESKSFPLDSRRNQSVVTLKLNITTKYDEVRSIWSC